MKNLTLIFCFAFLYSISQTVNSDCNSTDSIIKIYRNTADKLSIRHNHKALNTYIDSISIDKQLSNRYLSALLAVYNASLMNLSDTVRMLKIVLDNSSYPTLNNIVFEADSTKNEIINLRANIIPCGNFRLDSIISKHQLKVTYSRPLSFIFQPQNNYNCTIRMRTDSNCYAEQLAYHISQINPIIFGNCYPNRTIDNVHQIFDSIASNFIELTYCWGWGDCISGCINRRCWSYRVYNDCKVEYLGSYGNAIPSGMINIQEMSKQTQPIVIYPNPAKNTLYFNGLDSNSQEANIELLNSLGQIILKQENYNLSNSSSINVSTLSTGLYFIRLYLRGQITLHKIVIERQ